MSATGDKKRRIDPKRKQWFLLLFALFLLLLAEGIARVFYHPPALHTADELGKSFEPHPYLGYTGQPPLVRYGEERADAVRIACLGGSTTRSQYPPYLLEALTKCGAPGGRAVVYDAACPGYTSMESQLMLMIYVLPKRPRFVVVMHAHNDVQVRLAPGFKADYSHYRINPWRRITRGELIRKEVNALLDHVRLIVLLREAFTGYVTSSRILENYVCQPTWPADPKKVFAQSSVRPFEQHMRNIFWACKGAGVRVIFVTQPLSPRFRECFVAPPDGVILSGQKPTMQQLRDEAECYLRGQKECNDAVRRLAAECGAGLADWAKKAAGAAELFSDHVHLTDEGNRALARFIAREIAREWPTLDAGLRTSPAAAGSCARSQPPHTPPRERTRPAPAR